MSKNFSEKILIIIDSLAKETGTFLYPYKGVGSYFKEYQGNFPKAIYDLKRRGYLEEVEIGNKKGLNLTRKGKLKIITRNKDKQWDGLWRLIAFDIEEKRRKNRRIFREKLSELGCKPIQKSLWVTPYDISGQLEDLIDLLNLRENVEYFVTRRLSRNEKYLKKFGLN